jgi:uncharacterized membrane protein YeaQ/YmgE (transglycosylase-associated protein family)
VRDLVSHASETGGGRTCGIGAAFLAIERRIAVSILGWIILGGLAGWLASVLVRGTGLGIIADILVGIVGAFIGGIIVSALGGQGITGFNIWSFIVALIGAIVLLLIVRLFTGGRRRTSAV